MMNRDYKMLKITDLPVEMLWSIMKWCDFLTSKTLAWIFKMKIQDAYQYHSYSQIHGSITEIFDQIKLFCLNSGNFKSLIMNESFLTLYTPSQLLIFASGFGNFSTVTKYSKESDPSVENNLACRLSSSHGHYEIVEFLIKDPRVDPSDMDNFSLKTASQHGYIRIVNILLKDARVDPSASDNFALGVASIQGHIDIVEALLMHDRLNLPNEFWGIKYAFMKGNAVIVSLLCKHLGLDVKLWE